MHQKMKLRYSAPPPALHVLLDGTEVATLERGRDGFRFRYLSSFSDKDLAPLPGLPNTSDTQWRELGALPRFFKERIPDLDRPEIREQVQNSGIDPNDEMALLGALSRRAITDPFELVLGSRAA
ncbi:MAG TPA: HipA N-terminal domain-containing protein [Terriglobales bacterium]|nr:HipA N-terminal domain-containing protein [Terriglobales bacterium]